VHDVLKYSIDIHWYISTSPLLHNAKKDQICSYCTVFLLFITIYFSTEFNYIRCVIAETNTYHVVVTLEMEYNRLLQYNDTFKELFRQQVGLDILCTVVLFWSTKLGQVWQTMQTHLDQHGGFEDNSLADRKPMQITQQRCMSNYPLLVIERAAAFWTDFKLVHYVRRLSGGYWWIRVTLLLLCTMTSSVMT